MKSHVYLDPMTPDGKPGEVREIQVNDAAPQFLAPVSYADNDDLGKLRHNVHTAAAKLQHAKARGVGVPQAQRAHEDAKTAAGKAHYEQQKARTQQKTGIDFGAPSPFSRDTRQFAEVVDYSVDNDYDDNDEADDADDDALQAKISALVAEMEQAVSDGRPEAEVQKLADAIKVLREQLQTPLREQDPPRKSHIRQNPGGEKDTTAITAPFPGAKPLRDSGQSLREFAAAVAAAVGDPPPKKKKPTEAERKAEWKKYLDDLDKRLAAKALAAVYQPLADKPAKATHARNVTVCCEGAYKCDECRRKAVA
jgi:hypothetical protein